MSKHLIKSYIAKFLFLAIDFFWSITFTRRFLGLFHSLFLRLTYSVEHDGVSMQFSCPNPLSYYRYNTFSTKEPNTLKWIDSMPQNSVFWDVGANIGIYSVYAAKRVSAITYSFEPSVFNLEILARNIFLNRLGSLITIIPLPLTDHLGINKFQMSSIAQGSALSSFGSSLDQHGKPLDVVFEYSMLGITMNQAHELLHLPLPDFLKIDVDGIEHLILGGGSDILSSVKSVLIEISDDYFEQSNQTSLYLRNAGLKLVDKCDGDGTSQYNQIWVRSPD